MIIFNNNDKVDIEKFIQMYKINVNVINIEFKNSYLDNPNLFDAMCDIIESLMYQEDRVLITINNLNLAYSNLPEELANNQMYKYKMPLLLKAMISSGHEIAILAIKGDVQSDMLELDEINGIDIFYSEAELFNHVKKNIL